MPIRVCGWERDRWYAAEEVGLVGSAAIANSRRNNGDEVYAMLQLGEPRPPLLQRPRRSYDPARCDSRCSRFVRERTAPADMTGYGDYTTTPVKVLADFTDVELTNYIKTLLDEYTAFTRRDHSCG